VKKYIVYLKNYSLNKPHPDRWLVVTLTLFYLTASLLMGGCQTPQATERRIESDSTRPTINLGSLEQSKSGKVGLSGTGVLSTTLQIIVDGEVSGTTDVRSDGSWGYLLDVADAGEYRILLNTLDDERNIINSSDTYVLPLGSSVMADSTRPTINLGSLEQSQSGKVGLSGTGVPSTTLQIIVDGEVSGTTDVRSDGSWGYILDAADAGEYRILLNTLDDERNIINSSDTHSFFLPPTEISILTDPILKTTPTEYIPSPTNTSTPTPSTTPQQTKYPLTPIKDSVPSQTSTPLASDVLIGQQPAASDTPVPIETPFPSGVSVPQIAHTSCAINNLMIKNGNEVFVSGLGKPGESVEVLIGIYITNSTVVNDDGTWSSQIWLSSNEGVQHVGCNSSVAVRISNKTITEHEQGTETFEVEPTQTVTTSSIAPTQPFLVEISVTPFPTPTTTPTLPVPTAIPIIPTLTPTPTTTPTLPVPTATPIILTLTPTPTTIPTLPVPTATPITPTLTPTPTWPSSTATPVAPTLTATSIIAIAQVTRYANVRSGPGVNFPVVYNVLEGSSVTVIGYNNDVNEIWYKLVDGQWIWGNLLAGLSNEVFYLER